MLCTQCHEFALILGVWVDDEKVAAVGISSSRWITTHGFALNVDPNLDYFDTSVILPCGIEDKGVTSMAKILNTRGERVPSLPEVAQAVLHSFEQVFGVHNFKECDTPSF
jgi:lipoate-protein ligase B